MKETMNNHNDSTRAKAEVISAIRNIPNKDEVFAALTRNTKRLTKAGVKYSADGGKITLGGIVVDMNEVIGLNPKQAETFFNNLNREAPTIGKVNQTSNSNTGLKTALSRMLNDLKVEEGSGMNLNNLVVLTSNLFKFCCSDVRTQVVEAVRQAVNYVLNILLKPLVDDIDKIIPKTEQCYQFLRIGMSFFSKIVDEWEERYQMYVETGDEQYYHSLFDTVKPEYAKRAVAFFEFIVRSSFNGESLATNVLNQLSGYITAWVVQKIDEFSQSVIRRNALRTHSATYRPRKIDCSCCGGYYYRRPN